MTKKEMKASHIGGIHIGDMTIPCYVLEDGSRVLSQRGLNKALQRPEGKASDGADNLPSFVGIKALKPFISKELATRISVTIYPRYPLWEYSE